MKNYPLSTKATKGIVHKNTIRLALLILFCLSFSIINAQTPTLEMYSGAGNPTGNGITTANQQITFQKNTTNPTNSTIGAYTPAVSVTYSLSNQQYTSIEGNAGVAATQFGGNLASVNSPVPGSLIFSAVNSLGGSVRTNYTACNSCTVSTGIDTVANRSVELTNYTDALITSTGVQNFALNARIQYTDITFTFNQPVSNPVLHITGLGGFNSYSTGGTINYTQGFSTEFDMVTAGLSFTRLSGSTFFSVTPTTVRNSATKYGASTLGSPVGGGITRYAASGTVAVRGTNITTFTLRMYIQGDGGSITNNSGGTVAATNGNTVRWATHAGFIPGGGGSALASIAGDGFLLGLSLQAPVTVTGNVFNDPNAGFVNNSTGSANIVPSGMFANLRDANGNVVFSVPVNTDGTYTFPSVFEGPYTVSLSTVAGTQGSVAPPVNLPAGWVSTGEFNGTPNTGNDGTANGISSSFTVATTNVTNINFGIEERPTPDNITTTPVVNPGGTTSHIVTPGNFAGFDNSNGFITSLRITAFPSNATSITINGTTYTSATFPVGGVSVPTLPSGEPTQTISVDPIDGAVTVSIPYRVTDNAGVESTVTGAVNIPFTTIGLSGRVYNDVNGIYNGGLNNGEVDDGTGLGNPSGTTLYANLISGGVVVGTVPVNADGTYNFPVVSANTTYSVQISTNQGVLNSAPPTTALPANWVNTGEDCCDGIANDGNTNGLVTLTTGISNVTNANFGIEQLPNSGNVTLPTQTTPNGNNDFNVPNTAFSGTDPNGGTVDSIRITSFPAGLTDITINGTVYTSGSFPVGGVTIVAPGGVPPVGSILIDPSGNGASTITIPYVSIDNAHREDPTPGSVVIPFENITISGNVFNDVGGLITNANVNGVGIGLPSGVQLYANLLNAAGTQVIATVPVNADGTYQFSQSINNITTNTTYQVQLSTNQGTIGAATPALALPPNWVNTGEDCCDNTGSDGATNGLVTVPLGTVSLTNANFGIEQLPNSGVNTQPSQINPGGTTSVSVPATAFSGTDPDGGTPTTMRITSFPTNATSITVNGVTYAAATFGNLATAFPNGIPVNASGQPTVPISVDPVDGNVNVVIDYAILDEARQQDPTPGSITLPFFTVNLSGNVFNDVGGLLADGTVNGTGIATPSGTQLYANLLNAAGTTVIASVPINPDGSYNFNGIAGNTNYVVQVSSNQGTAGQPTPATALPTNWVNTGENVGTGAGNDGSVNGLLPVSVLAANVTNANFGIEQLPESGTNTQPSQPNPPGTGNVTVPPTAFSATDPDGGTVTSIRITAFPSNATSITINGTTYTAATFPVGGVVVPTNTSGQPTQTITVDPIDGLLSVVIPYAAIDNAGKEDPTPGSVTLPFSNINLSGNVFNDGNGLNSGGNVDGTGIGSASGTQLYANLLDATGTTVIASVPVNADGTYNFYGINANTNYTVQLSINQGIAGDPAPVKALPAGWVNTGEDCCDNTGDDGNVNGLLPVAITTTSVTNANLGIDHVPSGVDITATPQLNPGGTIQVPVPPLNGTDPEDGTVGTTNTVRIDVIPTNATLYYDADGPGGNPPVAVTAGQVIPNYNPALLTIDPDPNDASQPALLATFQYSIADAAGVFDPVPNTVNMQFLQPVAITGTVYNDVNGSANNTHQNIQDGAETGTNAGSQLYAYLIDQTTGLIIRKDTINADGTWGFDGLPPVGNVRVMITSNNTTVGSAPPPLTLPTGWVNTSPLDTVITYNNPPGFIIQNVNFGIEELPESYSSTQPAQLNPGGTINVPVPAEAFYGEDVAIGTVTAIRITAFPSNATSITINGITYTSGTWPPGGVTIPTNGNGQPTQPISIDPIEGFVTVSIPYVTIDNAGREDPTPANADIPFGSILPVRLISFTAAPQGNIVALKWTVGVEDNVLKYEVEHSLNGINFTLVGNKQANGSRDYGYLHLSPAKGINYYRLKTVDKDGKIAYSEIRKVNFTDIDMFSVYPIPAKNELNITVKRSMLDKSANIMIMSIDGKLMYQRSANALSQTEFIDLTKLSSGSYILKITTNNEQITRKFEVLK